MSASLLMPSIPDPTLISFSTLSKGAMAKPRRFHGLAELTIDYAMRPNTIEVCIPATMEHQPWNPAESGEVPWCARLPTSIVTNGEQMK